MPKKNKRVNFSTIPDSSNTKLCFDYGSLDYRRKSGEISIMQGQFNIQDQCQSMIDTNNQSMGSDTGEFTQYLGMEDMESEFTMKNSSPRFQRRRDRRNLKKFRETTTSKHRSNWGMNSWSADTGTGKIKCGVDILLNNV